jgi:hypothetical protein
VANTALFAQFGRRLTEPEASILLGSLQSRTYEEIAETSGYAISYLKRDVGPKLWKLLEQALGEPVSKTNFRSALEDHWRKLAIATTQVQALTAEPLTEVTPFASSANPSALSVQASTPKADWGETIDVSNFYGRSIELTTLTRWIVGDRCRLIALLGMGGIGKTALSVKLANQLLITSSIQGRTEFEYVIWRSLRNAPPLETLLADLVPFLSTQQDTQNTLNRLMHHLRSARCLIILDNLETILQGGNRAGQFRAGYESYGELLRQVSESNHQSCLLLTSREKPAEVAAFEGVDFKVRSLPLSGSEQAAQAILKAKGLVGSDTQKQILCDCYGNSPLALKIVATSIQDLFSGEIGEFLEQDTVIFNGIRRLLDQQFDRLSPLEKTIMYWLAINRERTSIAELQDDIIPAASKGKLLETLESLNWRSLIEKQSGSYTQQPVVMEYVMEQFIEQVITELNTVKLSLFTHYALIKTTVKDYVQESQTRLILGAIASEFSKVFSSIASLEQQVLRVLMELRQSGTKISGYGAGNLINLCIHLQLDLTSYDFSGLTIRHAYLQKVNLHHVNFARAELAKSAFTQTFGDVLSLAFSPDGKLFALGDSTGKVRILQIGDYQPLITLEGHTSWVWSVMFSSDGKTIASGSADSTVKIWNIHTGQVLFTLRGHLNQVCSVAFNSQGNFLASGSHDRSVRLWDVTTGQALQTLKGHTSDIWCVNFSPDGQILASGSQDCTIILWDIPKYRTKACKRVQKRVS